MEPCFNASLVRLKPRASERSGRRRRRQFQCQPGSIKACVCTCGRWLCLSFQCQPGSIKASPAAGTYASWFDAFQCQPGSIKATWALGAYSFSQMFQCQPGSIKAMATPGTTITSGPGFNASLVRLKLQHPQHPARSPDRVFQCQPGSIKAPSGPRAYRGFLSFNASLVRLKHTHLPTMSRDLESRFNASLVRLKPATSMSKSISTLFPRVSMPAWFD